MVEIITRTKMAGQIKYYEDSIFKQEGELSVLESERGEIDFKIKNLEKKIEINKVKLDILRKELNNV